MWIKIWISTKKTLKQRENQEDKSSKERKIRPRIIEVLVFQDRLHNIPLSAIVTVNLVRQLRQIAILRVESHFLTQPVKQIRNLKITSQPMLDNTTVMQIANILWRIYQIIHEYYVGCNVIARVDMALFESYKIRKERFGTVMESSLGISR